MLQQSTIPKWQQLQNLIELNDKRIENAEKTREAYAGVVKQRAKVELENKKLIEVSNVLQDKYQATKNYLVDKETSLIETMNKSLALVSALIPATDKGPIYILTDSSKKSSRVVQDILDESGTVIKKAVKLTEREGGGVRTIVPLLMAHIIVHSTPNAIPLMVLDERLAEVSQNTVQALKDVLKVMSKDTTIVGIEQRPSTYNDIADESLEAVLVNDKTTYVRRV